MVGPAPTSPTVVGTPAATTSTTGGGTVSRPNPKFKHKGKAYWVSSEKLTYEEANEKCRTMGGKLASVHDLDIFMAIVKKVSPEEAWADGSFDESSGGYRSSDNRVIDAKRVVVDERGDVAKRRISLFKQETLRASGSNRMLQFVCEWSE